MEKQFNYNSSDPYSIWKYSQCIVGHTLNDVIGGIDQEDNAGRGRLGQMLEHYLFGYKPNSNPTPDFEEAGVELKCTPLKRLSNGSLQIKERLVCSMIDFSEDYKYPFRESHFYLKCARILIMMYLHQSDVPVQDLQFVYSVLWEIPEKDLLIMEQDYKKIIDKIRCGKAHELSEGDTTYLGACRKGHKGDTVQEYTLPNGEKSSIPAPKRAYSLKPQYMRTILDYVKHAGRNAVSNTKGLVKEYGTELVLSEELKNNTFENILLGRFNGYIGKSYSELCGSLGLEESKAKSKYAMIANAILTLKGERGRDVTKSEEFIKSGIRLKTIRIQKSGRPKEAMSFENIHYFDILQEDDWYESRLYELFSSRFLFIVFKDVNGDSNYTLQKLFFWTMPNEDLRAAELYWQNIKNNVETNKIESNYFYRESEHRMFHVRPKAKDSSDLAENPNGGTCKKYCYWFNHEYIQQIVENHGK